MLTLNKYNLLLVVGMLFKNCFTSKLIVKFLILTVALLKQTLNSLNV